MILEDTDTTLRETIPLKACGGGGRRRRPRPGGRQIGVEQLGGRVTAAVGHIGLYFLRRTHEEIAADVARCQAAGRLLAKLILNELARQLLPELFRLFVPGAAASRI